MPYESPLKYFRDQHKEPDKQKESQPTWHDPELELEDTFETENEVLSGKKEAKVEHFGSVAEKYYQTIEVVKGAKLKDEFKDDEAEQKIIENRKEMVLKYLRSILGDVHNYLSQVNYLQLQQANTYDDIEQYQSAIAESDGQRRVYHNKLISDLKIAIRLININFNADFPEDFRIEEESKMADRKNLTPAQLKEQMGKREYYTFPFSSGVFIDFSKAPKDPQGEREYIAHWALTVYADLSALETEIAK